MQHNIKQMKSQWVIVPEVSIKKEGQQNYGAVKAALKIHRGIYPKIFGKKMGNAGRVADFGIFVDQIVIIPNKVAE